MGRTPGLKSKNVSSPNSPKCHKLKINDLINLSLTPYPLSMSTEMVLAMNAEAGIIQNKLKVLKTNIKEVQGKLEHVESSLDVINYLHVQIQQEGKLSPNKKSKLKGLYLSAKSDTDTEIQLLQKALGTIYEIRNIRNELRLQAKHSGNKETIRRGALMKMLQNTAQTLPLWVGIGSEEPPPLCGAIQADQSYQAKAGDMVASLVQAGDGEENWILAEVINFNGSSGKYEVEDIDEEQRERMMLSKRRVIPLPTMRADPEVHPEALFQEGSVVNAIYPQTTCFYKGIVKCPPVSAVDDYEILFEDSSYSDGFAPPLRVAQRYVITYKEKKSKKE